MTLDEAIKHAEEVAKIQENNAKSYPRPNMNVKGSGKKYNACLKCAEEHRQLAEWLKDYKRLKEQEPREDAISRKAVLDYIYNDLGLGDEENGNDVERQMELDSSYRFVKSLPPFASHPKMGRWIEDLSDYDDKYPKHVQALWKCVECEKKQLRKSNYCPNCGAKMEVESYGL